MKISFSFRFIIQKLFEFYHTVVSHEIWVSSHCFRFEIMIIMRYHYDVLCEQYLANDGDRANAFVSSMKIDRKMLHYNDESYEKTQPITRAWVSALAKSATICSSFPPPRSQTPATMTRSMQFNRTPSPCALILTDETNHAKAFREINQTIEVSRTWSPMKPKPSRTFSHSLTATFSVIRSHFADSKNTIFVTVK